MSSSSPVASPKSATEAPGRLTKADIDAYRRDGFLVFHWPLFMPERLERLRRIAREYVAEAAEGGRAADLNQPHFSDARIFDFALDRIAVGLMEDLLGPDLLLWATQFFCKTPRTGAAVPWHADAHYWTNFISPVNVVSLYCALDEQTVANGCLRVSAGSHSAHGRFSYQRSAVDANPFFPKGVTETSLDAAATVDIELRAGEFILFDGGLLHGSDANRSPETRYSFTMRYAPTSCKVDAVSVRPVRRQLRAMSGLVRRTFTGRDIYRHQVFLIRGQDRAGNRYGSLPADVRAS